MATGRVTVQTNKVIYYHKLSLDLIECQHDDPTLNLRCLNRAIANGRQQVLEQGVQENWAWGIDMASKYKMILLLGDLSTCPANTDSKLEWVQSVLLKAINLQREHGHDLSRACLFIMQNQEGMFQSIDKKQASILLDYYLMFSLQNYDLTAMGLFQIQSKGKGLICIDKQGIQKNQFIVKYTGELYQPYKWYEKQDMIKSYQKEKNKKDVLLDFYNIMLEKQKNDPLGYDILVVDPISQGNFSSRLSHSCDPNCATLTTVSQGQYTLAMFAIKDVSYGEELSFDYCSFTDEKSEYDKANCLCATKLCRGKYLHFHKSTENLKYLNQHHCFLHRNAILLRAALVQQLSNEDIQLMEKHHVRQGILEGCPIWLRQWICLVLHLLDQEYSYNLAQEIDSYNKQQESLRYRYDQDTSSAAPHSPEEQDKHRQYLNLKIKGILDSRLQNLLFTVDKCKYVVAQTQEQDPPLSLLTAEQAFHRLWIDHTSPSVLIELKSLLQSILDSPDDPECRTQIQLILSYIDRVTHLILQSHLSPDQKMSGARACLLKISVMLRPLIKQEISFNFQLVHDVCYFYSFTYIYFSCHEYKAFQGDKIEIRQCDISSVGTYSQKTQSLDSRVVKAERKSYRPQYVWGQMVGWFKQTVLNPEASLSQDRRGTLSYPAFEYASIAKTGKKYPFARHSLNLDHRKTFKDNLLNKPSQNWPPKPFHWSFKNNQKMYGTVFFQQVYFQKLYQNEKSFLAQVLDMLDKPEKEQIDLFQKMEIRHGHFDSMFFLQVYEVCLTKAELQPIQCPSKCADETKCFTRPKMPRNYRDQSENMAELQDLLHKKVKVSPSE